MTKISIILMEILKLYHIPDEIISIIFEYVKIAELNDITDNIIDELEKNINELGKNKCKKLISYLFKNEIYCVSFHVNYYFLNIPRIPNITKIRIGECICESMKTCIPCKYGIFNIFSTDRVNKMMNLYLNILDILIKKYNKKIYYHGYITKKYLKHIKNVFDIFDP